MTRLYWLACAVLLFIGLTTLFSLGLAKSGNWFYKQFFYALLAIILFIGASRLSVSQWKQAAPYLAIGAIALLLSTLLFGDSHKGASRWIKVGLTMQPVEYFKFAFLLIGARQCARAALTNFGLDMIKPLFLWLFLPLFILLCQPDFGSFCLITAVAMVMLFLAGLRARWFILAILVFAALAYFLVQNSDYRLERLLSFWDPFDDRYNKDYNLVKSLMSYARGGFMGAGLSSIIVGRNLPEATMILLSPLSPKKTVYWALSACVVCWSLLFRALPPSAFWQRGSVTCSALFMLSVCPCF